MAECVCCDNFDMIANQCLIDSSICYKDQKCLREDCPKFVAGHWTTNEDEHYIVD